MSILLAKNVQKCWCSRSLTVESRLEQCYCTSCEEFPSHCAEFDKCKKTQASLVFLNFSLGWQCPIWQWSARVFSMNRRRSYIQIARGLIFHIAHASHVSNAIFNVATSRHASITSLTELISKPFRALSSFLFGVILRVSETQMKTMYEWKM